MITMSVAIMIALAITGPKAGKAGSDGVSPQKICGRCLQLPAMNDYSRRTFGMRDSLLRVATREFA